MGNDPTCVVTARDLIHYKIPAPTIVVAELLDHIDALSRIIERIEEDKDDNYE